MNEQTPQEMADQPVRMRAELGRRIFVVCLVIWGLFMSLAVLYGIVQFRSTQLESVKRAKITLAIAKDARTAADAAVRGTNRIEECTTPGKPCSNRGKRDTGKAVVKIGDYVIIASGCAVGVDPNLPTDTRIDMVTACTLQRLAKDKR